MAIVKSFIMEELIQDFQEALVSLDNIKADVLFQQALLSHSPIEVVEQFVVPALTQIGQQWNEGRIALSQIYMSGRFCEKLVERVLPPGDPDRKHHPQQAIVVLNDYHMLGMRIVFSVMRASGFELFNYGRMDVNELLERVIADKLQVLLISVLMLPSALKVRDLRTALDACGVQVKILVGGAPFQFDPCLWQEIGADAVGLSASDAVRIVKDWAREMT